MFDHLAALLSHTHMHTRTLRWCWFHVQTFVMASGGEWSGMRHLLMLVALSSLTSVKFFFMALTVFVFWFLLICASLLIASFTLYLDSTAFDYRWARSQRWWANVCKYYIFVIVFVHLLFLHASSALQSHFIAFFLYAAKSALLF